MGNAIGKQNYRKSDLQKNNLAERDNYIRIKGLNKFYGKKQALRDVDLSIGQGMFGLLGRNGAGKTTLMKTLATLLQKQSGEITVCGVPVENAGEIRKITGYLPQEFSMYPSMSVSEAMDYLAVLSGLEKRERKERIGELLEKVNLTEHRHKKVRALSGGMKRRLGIAQALLNNPRVLIVDEPTAGLDPEERVRFRNLLSELAEERIVILSTHIVGDIEATCEDIAILDGGRILYDGTVEGLLDSAEGKVFTVEADRRELAELKKDLLITGMHMQGQRACVRFVSQKAVDGARGCEPNIEDAYMLYLSENGVEAGALARTGGEG